jgi:phospholipid/cholesterol/gamma-HCH transport system permease protein
LPAARAMIHSVERLGRTSVAAIEEFGYAAALLGESFYWLFMGPRQHQTVRLRAIAAEMMEIGVRAVPICCLLLFTVGLMLGIQGIATLSLFGAESRIIQTVAISITREFSSLIVGILVAGRSGSALAARIGTMQVSQEVDALRVIGIQPVRYLVAPALLALLVMVPLLTLVGDTVGIFGCALYAVPQLDMTMTGYLRDSIQALNPWDIGQGLLKASIFAVLIALIGSSTGFSVSGGAEGVGKATTRAVVLSISAIIVADMIFTYFINR